VPALVRLVAGVRAYVLLQVAELREPPLADVAPVRFDAQMDARVLAQVRAVGECFVALMAFVRFHVFDVQLRVQLQFRLGCEYLLKKKNKKVSVNNGACIIL